MAGACHPCANHRVDHSVWEAGGGDPRAGGADCGRWSLGLRGRAHRQRIGQSPVVIISIIVIIIIVIIIIIILLIIIIIVVVVTIVVIVSITLLFTRSWVLHTPRERRPSPRHRGWSYHSRGRCWSPRGR
jgi:hypothetical protein